ncbi:MAG: gliding motility-associated peptidyl-prolyl isomerase GldI [Flavobacterium sp.]|jgi:gliding motility-associated peptidyl-prolyl isomerase|nr:gliding motility-associated peptidyl-prolyl isomerase GldI [uncultured Flavobacterium sp.]MDD2821441.1 gliding motility-associated peptidyl-prolyl isomerase GldI [Flavobacterium sp.]
MKNNPLFVLLFVFAICFTGCKQHQEARRPISQASGTFMKKSAERNKKLIASEEDQIQVVIKKNPKAKFIASAKGYWYSYEIINTLDTITPKKGDVAFFDYEIKNLKGTVIYSQLELKPQIYYVDKQNIMMGLRDGIKLMHKKEKINFFFTSQMGYGYHGDNKKIGTNQPLFCTVTLRDFMSEDEYKKQTEAKSGVVTKEPIAQIKSKDTLTN